MKKLSRLRIACAAVFLAVVVLFSLFFAYLGLFENVSTYRQRPEPSFDQVTDCQKRLIQDLAAPAGVRWEYTWALDASGGKESLCFYLVHQEAQVYLDGVLAASLQAGENNRFGKTPGSNWVFVPIYPEDMGRQVTVIVTPVFKNVIQRDVEFYVGSQYAVFISQLKHDAPQILLSVQCVILGIVIIGMTLRLNYHAGSKMYNMMFLGVFSILLGIWRIMDTRSSPILFPGNPMLLNYLSIGVLFLISPPMLLFLDLSYKREKPTLLTAAALLFSVAAAAVLAAQLLGIAEFKQLLIISHCIALLSIALAAVEAVVSRRKARNGVLHSSEKYIHILVAGLLLDLLVFYIRKNSSNVIFTMLAYVVYATVVFASSIFDTARRANTDGHTGLVNKARWDELMEDTAPADPAAAIIMMDLNNLKRINDTLGHDAGDKAILCFSNILRNTLPLHSVICRWGGDEFTVLMTNVTKEQVAQYVQDIHEAVEICNTTTDTPPISFAAGFALANEFPGMRSRELLAIADSRMYRDKQLQKKAAAGSTPDGM